MQNNDQWRLASKGLAGEATGEEMLQLRAMLDSDPAWKECYSILTRFWQQPVMEDKETAERAFDKTWKKIQEADSC